MKRSVKAFTLLELLVCISVIVILASLLLVSVVQGTEKARRVKCASNLKQVYLYIAFYTILDNDDQDNMGEGISKCPSDKTTSFGSYMLYYTNRNFNDVKWVIKDISNWHNKYNILDVDGSVSFVTR